MTEFDEYGYPILDEDSDIFPLTLLVDKMRTVKFGWLFQRLMMGTKKKTLQLMYHSSNMPNGNKRAR